MAKVSHSLTHQLCGPVMDKIILRHGPAGVSALLILEFMCFRVHNECMERPSEPSGRECFPGEEGVWVRNLLR